jgi:hypothetical protein
MSSGTNGWTSRATSSPASVAGSLLQPPYLC